MSPRALRPIIAQRVVSAPQDAIFAVLSDLAEHWALSDHWTEVREIGPEGGTIRLQGPLGLRRTAHVHVLLREPVSRVAGQAKLGKRTRALVSWDLAPADDGRTLVTLSAWVEDATWPDRVLLLIGGRRWLHWRFAVTLTRLEPAAARVAAQSSTA